MEKIKEVFNSPKKIAIITFIASIVSIIYILVNYNSSAFVLFNYYYIDTPIINLIDYFRPLIKSSVLMLAIYFVIILFKKNKKLKLLNYILFIHFIVVFFIILLENLNTGIYVWDKEAISYQLLVLCFSINLFLIIKNKNFNPKYLMIIEYVLFGIFILPLHLLILHGHLYGITFYFSVGNLIYCLPLISFTYYLYLYGKSKNRKD